MKDLVEFIAKALVEKPDEVQVTERLSGTDVIVEVQVAQADMGRMIGRSGRIINAIRALAQVSAARDGHRAHVELLEED